MEVERGERETIFGGYPAIGFVSIFYATMESPLSIWERQERRGEIRRIFDEDKNMALDLYAMGNLHSTYITTPSPPFLSLGITLPYLVFVIKNLNRNVAFTVQIIDDTSNRRRFLFSNAYKTSRVKTFSCHVPITLDNGWNEVAIDLASLTQKAYGTKYKETIRVQVHPNCRLRLIYFCAAPVGTGLAVEIMKGILSSGSGPSFKKSQSTGKLKLTESAADACSPVQDPTSATSSDPLTDSFIEKSLTWRRQLAAAKAKSAVFDSQNLYDSDEFSEYELDDMSHDGITEASSAPGGSKSCPQLTIGAEFEIQRLIEEELLNQDIEQCQLHERLDGSLETDLDIRGSLQAIQGSAIHMDSEIKHVDALMLEKAEDLEISQEDLNLNCNVLSAAASSSIVDTGNENVDKNVPTNDLEEQVDQLESVVQGLLQGQYPKSSTRTRPSPADIQECASTSKIDQLKSRIDKMKQKLRNLEQNFGFPTDPSQSSSPVNDSCPASGIPSGILRIPVQEASVAKLKPKLSVRFSTFIAESDKPVDSDLNPEEIESQRPSDSLPDLTTESLTDINVNVTNDEPEPRARPKTQ